MEQAIERLRSVPENQQDAVAEFLLHELAEDERWATSTRNGAAKLKNLADQILRDDQDGRCEPLNPDRL